MKFLILILFPLSVFSQPVETYYDYNWKPCNKEKASYYSLLEKTDSGWWRRDFYANTMQVQMRGLYRDSTCKVANGTIQRYHSNGYLSSIEKRVKGKLEGQRLQYYTNGVLMDSAFYQNHKQVGVRMQWHRNGYSADSSTRINDSTLVQVQWFDDGSPAASGYRVLDKQQGKWQYLHRNGKLAGVVVYNQDKIVSAAYYNEDGSLQIDTATVNKEAVFKKKGMEGWQNYLSNNTAWPYGYKLTNVNQVTVSIQFCVNEEGKVTEAEVVIPFHPVFDKEALKIIQQSPAWVPALQHNRKVKAWRRQPITFLQQL
jgi:TonB family protein